MKIRTNYLGAGTTFTIPLCTEALFNNDALSLTVDWGDGSSETISSFDGADTISYAGNPVGYKLTHTYAAKGRKVITLTGGYDNKLAFMPTVTRQANGQTKNAKAGGSRKKIEKIYECNIGTQFYIHGQGDFRGMSRLKAIGKNISALTSASPATAIALDTSASAGMFMDKTFSDCKKLRWFGDFSPVNAQSLQYTFFGCQTMDKAFHINNWDLTKVISAKGAFKNTVISVNLNKLFKKQSGVTYQITDVSHMFEGSNFNKGLNDWDMRTVTNVGRMFKNSQFNQNIWKWFKTDASTTYQVDNMVSMFEGSSFTRGISGWDVSSATKLNSVFKGAQFANDVSNWNINPAATIKNFRADNNNLPDNATPQTIVSEEEATSPSAGAAVTKIESFAASHNDPVSFGSHVHMNQDGTVLVVSGRQPATDTARMGSVYVYDRTGLTWTERTGNNLPLRQSKAYPDPKNSLASFFGQTGVKVSADGNTIVTSEYAWSSGVVDLDNKWQDPKYSNGRIVILNWDPATNSFSEESIEGEEITGFNFGMNFDTSESCDRIVVATKTGEVKVFEPNGLTGTSPNNRWSQLGSTITAADLDALSQYGSEQYNWSNSAGSIIVAMNKLGNRIALGCDAVGPSSPRDSQGSILTFEYNAATNTWDQIGSELNGAPLTPYGGEKMGGWNSFSFNKNGDRIAVKTNYSEPDKYGVGRIAVYELSSNNWNMLGGYIHTGVHFGGRYGESPSMNDSGSRIAFGAVYGSTDKTTNTDTWDTTRPGTVMVSDYDASTNSWSQVDELTTEKTRANFGGKLYLNGNGTYLVVGAPGADSSAGEVYSYSITS